MDATRLSLPVPQTPGFQRPCRGRGPSTTLNGGALYGVDKNLLSVQTVQTTIARRTARIELPANEPDAVTTTAQSDHLQARVIASRRGARGSSREGYLCESDGGNARQKRQNQDHTDALCLGPTVSVSRVQTSAGAALAWTAPSTAQKLQTETLGRSASLRLVRHGQRDTPTAHRGRCPRPPPSLSSLSPLLPALLLHLFLSFFLLSPAVCEGHPPLSIPFTPFWPPLPIFGVLSHGRRQTVRRLLAPLLSPARRCAAR